MNDAPAIPEQAQLSLDKVRRYMTARGWLPLERRNGAGKSNLSFDMFASSIPGSEQIRIILPQNSKAADFRLRIADAVHLMAEAEERTEDEVKSAIRRIGYDVVRSSVPTSQVYNDTIKLSTATEFVTKMRGLLATTATTEKSPKPYFARLLKESLQFADACRFGHTFRGSFGFILESPLPSEDPSLLPNAAAAPFERRVIERFAKGMAHVTEAAAQQGTSPITAHVTEGFGANGCEQFADLIEEVSPAGLTFSIDLSPEWADSQAMNNSTYTVSGVHAELCRLAARELRQSDISIEVNISGRIVRLQNQADPSDLTSRTGEREIVILWGSEQFGDILVRINLTPGDYLSAVGAHGAGRPVFVSGTLQRAGRQWVLLAPQGFSLIPQSELKFDF